MTSKVKKKASLHIFQEKKAKHLSLINGEWRLQMVMPLNANLVLWFQFIVLKDKFKITFGNDTQIEYLMWVHDTKSDRV